MDEKFKRRDEKNIADKLLETLNIKATFSGFGDDNGETDCFYQIENEEIGIEITTVYYDNSDAEQEMTLRRGERIFPKEGYEMRRGGAIWEPDMLLCLNIQIAINEKCKTSYIGASEKWLCILEKAQLSDEENLLQCIAHLTIPRTSVFYKIYLLHLRDLSTGGGYIAYPIVSH